MTRHLDPCSCGGTMKRYATKTLGRVRTRHLKCDRCGVTDVERFYIDKLGRPIYATPSTPEDTESIGQQRQAVNIASYERSTSNMDEPGISRSL